ncbi:MAG: peptidase M75, partial [Aquihabitans sp.]
MRTSRSRLNPLATVAAAVAVALAALAGCSTESADTTVAVTGTDNGCRIENDILTAGSVGFEFTNEAKKVNELYVVRENGDVVGEVENV